MPKFPTFDPIEFLISCRFPPARTAEGGYVWRSPEEGRTPAEILYEEELRQKDQSEIDALVGAETIKIQTEKDAEKVAKEAAAPFFDPEGNADFDFWCRASYWLLHEALALSMGKDPGKPTWRKIMDQDADSPSGQMVKKRYQLMIRALTTKELRDANSPVDFLLWAKRIELSYPPELEIVLEREFTRRINWKTRFDAEVAAHVQTKQALEETKGKALPLKERESLLKLVIGMAIGGYGFDPQAVRTPITAQISTDLLTNGVGLDEDTIRKYLQKAKLLLPQGETEQNP